MKCVCFSVLAALVCCLPSDAQFSSLRNLEDRMLFQPLTAAQSWLSLSPEFGAQDVWLRSSDGTSIHAWWFPQPNSTGAILLCHGNAGNLSHWAGRALTLRKTLGQSVLIFDYPGYGKSERPAQRGGVLCGRGRRLSTG